MPRNAEFCEGTPNFKGLWFSFQKLHNLAYRGIGWHIIALCSSKIVVGMGVHYYSAFCPLRCVSYNDDPPKGCMAILGCVQFNDEHAQSQKFIFSAMIYAENLLLW